MAVLCDPQTSGGLICAIPPERAEDFERAFKRETGARCRAHRSHRRRCDVHDIVRELTEDPSPARAGSGKVRVGSCRVPAEFGSSSSQVRVKFGSGSGKPRDSPVGETQSYIVSIESHALWAKRKAASSSISHMPCS